MPATPNTSVPQQLAKESINSKSCKKIAKKLLHDEVLSKEIKATAFNKKKSICNIISGKILKKYKLLNFTAKKYRNGQTSFIKTSTKSSKVTASNLMKNCTLRWGTSTTEMTTRPAYSKNKTSRKWKAEDLKGATSQWFPQESSPEAPCRKARTNDSIFNLCTTETCSFQTCKFYVPKFLSLRQTPKHFV